MKKKTKASPAAISTYEVVRKMRSDWGAISPVSRVISNKKKNKKEKHKGRMYEYDYD